MTLDWERSKLYFRLWLSVIFTSFQSVPLEDKVTGVYNVLTNRLIASVIPAVVGIYLAASGNFTILWPSFGAANQLIASVALMTGTCYINAKLKSRFADNAIIPAWFLWITVTAALVWFMVVVLPGSIATAHRQRGGQFLP